jgi:hypothetical protein
MKIRTRISHLIRPDPKIKIDDSPVTQESHQNLTNNNAGNLEIAKGVDPIKIADRILRPTSGEGSLQKWSDISDGEEHVTVSMGRQSATNIVSILEFTYFNSFPPRACPLFSLE